MKPSTETPASPDAHPGDFINTVAQNLHEIASQDVAKLPEDQFVHVFLPLLARDAELPYPVTMADWISIAGGPCKPVDVFDNATGQTLFRVPPFLDYHGINPVRDIHNRAAGQAAFTDIVATAAKLAGLHPNQAKAFIEQSLRERASFMNNTAVLALHVLQWNAILGRYGREPLYAESEKAAGAALAAKGGPVTPDVYEDF